MCLLFWKIIIIRRDNYYHFKARLPFSYDLCYYTQVCAVAFLSRIVLWVDYSPLIATLLFSWWRLIMVTSGTSKTRHEILAWILRSIDHFLPEVHCFLFMTYILMWLLFKTSRSGLIMCGITWLKDTCLSLWCSFHVIGGWVLCGFAHSFMISLHVKITNKTKWGWNLTVHGSS